MKYWFLVIYLYEFALIMFHFDITCQLADSDNGSKPIEHEHKNHSNKDKKHPKHNHRSDSDYNYAYYHRNNIRKLHSENNHVLIIGDSVDRHMLWDWCERNRVTDSSLNRPAIETLAWLSYPYQYEIAGDFWEYGYRCMDSKSGDTISTAHVYGSGNTGPYYYNIRNQQNNLSYDIDTEPRVLYILDSYVKRYGMPNKVFIHTSQWDKKHFYYDFRPTKIVNNSSNQAEVWKDELQLFEMNMNHRIDQIQGFMSSLQASHFHHHICKIGLRTAIWNYDEGEKYLLHAMNNVTRAIAKQRKLLLYDVDYDIWYRYGDDMYNISKYDIYRDGIHPRLIYSIAAADKIIGHRYTNFIYDYADLPASYLHMELEHMMRYNMIYLIQTKRDLYMIQRLSSDCRIYGRWSMKGLSRENMMNIFMLGSSDILLWDHDDDIQRLTKDKGSIPIQFNSSSHVLASLRVDNDPSKPMHALLFHGYYLLAFNRTIWKAWVDITSASARIAEPLPSFWTQYDASLFTYRGQLDVLPGIPDQLFN